MLSCHGLKNNCDGDNCKFIIDCKKDEVCFGMIGFRNQNLSNVDMSIGGCFKDINCVSNDKCIGEYDSKNPFISDYFCCCNTTFCNKYYELRPQIIQETTGYIPSKSSPLDIHPSGAELSVLVAGIILFIIAAVISILFVKRRYNKKLKLKQQRQQLLLLNNNNNNNNNHQTSINTYVQIPIYNQDQNNILQQQSTLPISKLLINDHQEAKPLLLDQTPPSTTTTSTTSSNSTTSSTKKNSFSIENFKLLNEIASGQFSIVWKGKFNNDFPELSIKSDDLCAIKIFQNHEKQSWTNEKDIYSNIFENEFILKFFAAEINHCVTSKQYWLIVEYHQNGSLYDYLKINTLTWKQICNYSLSILNGLAYLHCEISNKQNCLNNKPTIAHRDIKSKNILVKSNGTCCISDFGLAVTLINGKLNSSEIKSQVGTRRYMSPELLEGAITFTKDTLLRIDVYACALVLWELISRGNFYDEMPTKYELPYEKELGLYPTLDEMQEFVVTKNQRPIIKSIWSKKQTGMSQIIKTIEECWDIHVEARLSSECAAARLRKLFTIEYS